MCNLKALHERKIEYRYDESPTVKAIALFTEFLMVLNSNIFYHYFIKVHP